jgi:hypothetical protein
MTLLPALLIIASYATLDPQPRVLVVDPAASTKPGTFASVDAAIKAAESAPTGVAAIEIDVHPGVYEVRSPLHIGKLPAPLRIHGAGAGTRLVGGAVLRQHLNKVADDDPVRTRLPREAIDNVRWIDLAAASTGGRELSGPARHGMNLPAAAGSELFMNGRPLTVARWPNEGFAPISGVVDPGTSKDRVTAGETPRGGTFRVVDREHLARWAGARDVWLSGFWCHDWADDQMPAGKIDPEAGTITLGMPHTYGLAKGAQFAVTNIPEELDSPGEYWIDVAGKRAYVWPPAAAGTEDPEFVVSLLTEPILTFDGAADVEIVNLAFEAGRGLAIRATAARNVRIEHCAFRDNGTGAIELDGAACDVGDCSFEDIGASGVFLDGGDRATLTHANNRIHDCTFRRCARTHLTYQPAVRLDGVGQTVANCRIEELPHSAIIFAGNEHTIELNDIGRVLLGTGDCGAIYCGRDWTLHGTVIRNNLFHDLLGTDARYQNAVYLDDMASGITVEGNIFLRCHWGLLVGGGRDVTIRGNIFDSCGKAMSFDKRGVGWMAKSIADPAKSTLHQRLRAVPIDREPWSTRYPTLSSYLTDRFGRPANGVVTGNILLATPLGTIADRECVTVENNTELKASLPSDELAALVAPERRHVLADLAPAQAPQGFKPIPVARIGPRSEPDESR